MTQENAAKGAALDAAKELVKKYPERHPEHKVLIDTMAMMKFVANEINTSITESERRLDLFRLSMELSNFR